MPGKYYEDYNVGDRFTTPSRQVTLEDMDRFIALSRNDDPLHTDDDFARSLGYRERLVPGMFTVSILVGLTDEMGLLDGVVLAHLGIDALKFLRPVYALDTIHGVVEITGKKPTRRPGAGIVTSRVEAANQDGAVVVAWTNHAMVRTRKEKEDS